MKLVPRARFAEMIVGSIDGVRPTPIATANSNAWSQSPVCHQFSRKTVGAMINMIRISNKVMRRMARS